MAVMSHQKLNKKKGNRLKLASLIEPSLEPSHQHTSPWQIAKLYSPLIQYEAARSSLNFIVVLIMVTPAGWILSIALSFCWLERSEAG